MARVTATEVQAVTGTTSVSDLTPMIDSASLMVDRLAATECGEDLTTSELKEIERYLAAHFVAVTDPSIAKTKESFEGASIEASRGNVSTMSGLMSTQFGQMASVLSNGCLEQMNKPKPQIGFF